MKFPPWLMVYGDQEYRGTCPKEDVEQVSLFNRIRKEYPDSWGRLALHPRNEQQLRQGQFSTVMKHAAEGMTPGASDVIIPGAPSLVIEIKRRDHTLSSWQPGQVAYLEAAHNAGAFACVALGAIGAWSAFNDWIAKSSSFKL